MGLIDSMRSTLGDKSQVGEFPNDELDLSKEGLTSFLNLTGPRTVSLELQDKLPGGPLLQCQYCHDKDKNLLMRVFHQGLRVISIEVVLPEDLAIEMPNVPGQVAR